MTQKKIIEITEKIASRSQASRTDYLNMIEEAQTAHNSKGLSAGNVAHATAACPVADKKSMIAGDWAHLAIVTAYNDMLSAHQPYERYPELIRGFAREFNATTQVAGGVPAMCDGVTQGQPGMELSLFSRDVIAMSTAVALSHNTFDAAIYLGICDKIVPGLLMGALQFGHLPSIFIPSGPMPSGLANEEKSRVRKAYARGEASREELLETEMKSYHSAGTCTFYGTANSNQMLMEIMGLHVPGAAFVPPETDIRDALTRVAVKQLVENAQKTQTKNCLAEIVNEKSIVNAMIGLLATGGSTNHTIHLPAIARAAGILINWDDFDELSQIVPLICKIYPNGKADINQFHAAGGMSYVTRTLLDNGYLHNDVKTVLGDGLEAFASEPVLKNNEIEWRAGPTTSGDASIISDAKTPFSANGGLRTVSGNLGRGVVKVSAVKPEHYLITAPARVFYDQNDVVTAFENGELERDVIIILLGQGPKSNGMPELHKLTPPLGALLEKGFNVALVTDGRMSGASGAVPAAIQITPEASENGFISLVKDGDMICLDCTNASLTNLAEDFSVREIKSDVTRPSHKTMGRNLFSPFRNAVSGAESGGSVFFEDK
ncbi:MAG TPA: phosphogluconate dehydratase [Rhodobiaceae bacterium]|nr:phosphogluconate dehydratase [Rhodobiaceae bacterium]|tara:strand:+ start:2714 stop:4525 length:1812 start_codon:yes stop_codon:yes gene_type:complete